MHKEKTFDIPIYRGLIKFVFTDEQKKVQEGLYKNEDLEGAFAASEHVPFGTTYTTSENNIRCIMIVLNPTDKEWIHSILVHEIVHAADNVLSIAGYNEGGEPLAYLVEYFYNLGLQAAKELEITL